MNPEKLRRDEDRREQRAEARAGLIFCIVFIGTILLFLASI
jgi:hypothetical protein